MLDPKTPKTPGCDDTELVPAPAPRCHWCPGPSALHPKLSSSVFLVLSSLDLHRKELA